MSNIVRRGPQTGIEILDDIRRSSDAETSQKKQQVVRRRSGGSSGGGSSSSPVNRDRGNVPIPPPSRGPSSGINLLDIIRSKRIRHKDKGISSEQIEEETMSRLESTVVNKPITVGYNQLVRVTWEDASGKTTTTLVKGKNLSGFEGSSGGRIVSVSDRQGRVFYDVPTSGEYESAYMDISREHYQPERPEGFIGPIKPGGIPSSFREKVTVPDVVQELGLSETYVRESYEDFLGLNPKKTHPEGFVGPVDTRSDFEKIFQRKIKEPKTLTKQQYYQEIYNLMGTYQKQGKDTTDLQKELNRIEDWAAGTTVKRTYTKDGYQYKVDFPYSGGAYEGKYRREKAPGVKGLSGFFSPTDPLGVTSSFYMLTGDTERARQKRIESYGYFHGAKEAREKGGLEGLKHFGTYIVSSPIVHLGATPALALTGGTGYSYLMGRLAFKSVAVQRAASIGLAAAGVGLMVPSASSIVKDIQTDRPGEAFAKSSMLASQLIIGRSSFKLGQRMFLKTKEGSFTSYELGAMKGYSKHIQSRPDLAPDVKANILQLHKDLAYQVGMSRQLHTSRSSAIDIKHFRVRDIKTLSDKPIAQEFTLKAGKYFGKDVVEKGSSIAPESVIETPKDFDAMMTPLGKATYSYFWRSRYPDVKKPWDIHPLTRVGDPTGSGRLGGVRLPSVMTEEGTYQISPVEWVDRLRVSSSELSHKGRIKDIQRLPSVLKYIYKEAGFIKETDVFGGEVKTEYDFPSTKWEDAYVRSIKGLETLEKNPVMMRKQDTLYYDKKSLHQRFYDYRVKLHSRLPGMEHRIKRIVDPTGELASKRTSIVVESDDLAAAWVTPPINKSHRLKYIVEKVASHYSHGMMYPSSAYYHYPKIHIDEDYLSNIQNLNKDIIFKHKASLSLISPYTKRAIHQTPFEHLKSTLIHEKTHLEHSMWGEKVVEWYELKGSHPSKLNKWAEETATVLLKPKKTQPLVYKKPQQTSDMPPYKSKTTSYHYKRSSSLIPTGLLSSLTSGSSGKSPSSQYSVTLPSAKTPSIIPSFDTGSKSYSSYSSSSSYISPPPSTYSPSKTSSGYYAGYYHSPYVPSPISRYGYGLPSMGSRRGGGDKRSRRLATRYRFRSFDVPSLEKIIRGVKFKL